MTNRRRGVVLGIAIIGVVVALAGCVPARPAARSATSRPPASADRLPVVAGGIRALWQGAPWPILTFAGPDLLGAQPGKVHAVRAATGAPLWTVAMPGSASEVLGLIPAGNVVVVAAGHQVGQGSVAQFPIVSEYIAVGLATGRRLWSVPVGGQYQSPRIAVSGRYLLTGDPSGAVTARIAATGAVVWRDTRPSDCGAAPTDPTQNAGLGLAADGPLLAVSFECRSRIVVKRLDPASGRLAWTWRSPSAGSAGLYMAVTGAALQGGEVLVTGGIGGPPWAQRFVSQLPHARTWPSALGPNDAESIVLALDAASGHPRWSELGGQQVTVAPSGGAVCEVVKVGAECRDDTTGAATMPTLLTGRGEGSSPPYFDDGYAGVSGGLVAVTLPSRSGGVILRVQRARGGGVVARVQLAIGASGYDGARYDVFAVGAGPLGSGAILVLVRRIDVPGYPVLALDVPLPAGAAQ